jgi:SPP1 family predicted phage head-tail adaptor
MSREAQRVPTAARRARLTLEAPVETPDVLGGAAITFEPVATLWARIEAHGGRERVTGAAAEGVVETRITLRWRDGVDARMRFTDSARLFLIRAVSDPDGRRRDLVCLCEEITP